MNEYPCCFKKCPNYSKTEHPNNCLLWIDINDCEYYLCPQGTIRSIVAITVLFLVLMVGVPAAWGVITYLFPSLDVYVYKFITLFLHHASYLRGN